MWLSRVQTSVAHFSFIYHPIAVKFSHEDKVWTTVSGKNLENFISQFLSFQKPRRYPKNEKCPFSHIKWSINFPWTRFSSFPLKFDKTWMLVWICVKSGIPFCQTQFWLFSKTFNVYGAIWEKINSVVFCIFVNSMQIVSMNSFLFIDCW